MIVEVWPLFRTAWVVTTLFPLNAGAYAIFIHTSATGLEYNEHASNFPVSGSPFVGTLKHFTVGRIDAFMDLPLETSMFLCKRQASGKLFSGDVSACADPGPLKHRHGLHGKICRQLSCSLCLFGIVGN